MAGSREQVAPSPGGPGPAHTLLLDSRPPGLGDNDVRGRSPLPTGLCHSNPGTSPRFRLEGSDPWKEIVTTQGQLAPLCLPTPGLAVAMPLCSVTPSGSGPDPPDPSSGKSPRCSRLCGDQECGLCRPCVVHTGTGVWESPSQRRFSTRRGKRGFVCWRRSEFIESSPPPPSLPTPRCLDSPSVPGAFLEGGPQDVERNGKKKVRQEPGHRNAVPSPARAFGIVRRKPGGGFFHVDKPLGASAVCTWGLASRLSLVVPSWTQGHL